jgi:hypothetical protein
MAGIGRLNGLQGMDKLKRGHGNEHLRGMAMLKKNALLAGLLLLPTLCTAQSAFEGTWRPDPQRPSHPA